MPVVRSGETGLELLADNAEHFIRRTVAEEDFAGSPDAEVRDGEGWVGDAKKNKSHSLYRR